MQNKLLFLKPMKHICLHEGSCFRELLDAWYENDFIDLDHITQIESIGVSDTTLIPESRPWINKVGDILLYDQPLLDKLPPDFRFGLFANEVLHSEKTDNWIFWPRYPKKYFSHLSYQNIHTREERNINSIFIGNKTTAKRSDDWMANVAYCTVGSSLNHLTQNMIVPYEHYVDLISHSKFGLCLPGVGPKCLREPEYLGVGTVPIFTPGVSNDYYNKLEENKHYLFCSQPEDLKKVIKDCTDEQWEYMSNECVKWFAQNCSLRGSFDTTIEILEKNNVI